MLQRILRGLRRLAPVALWSLGWLLLIDIAVGFLAAPPKSFKKRPSSLQSYFEFGRSTEGKLRRAVLLDGSSSIVAKTGWLGVDQTTNPAPPVHRKADDPRPTVSIYGMSYALHMRNQLDEIDGLNLRFWGGPGAAPNHAYTAYLKDRGRHESDVVVFAMVTDALRGIVTTTGATKGFDGLPFMYPRYFVQDGELKSTEVFCESLDCFREMLQSPERWSQWRAFLEENDAFYSPLLFDETPLDASVTVRLARKAWSQSFQREHKRRLFDGRDFSEEVEEMRALRLMVRRFSEQARADGQVPVVVLFSNVGFSDALYRFLGPTLDEHGIPYVSSHEIAPPEDPRSYGPDNYHFTDELRAAIAEAFIAEVAENGIDLRALARPHAGAEYDVDPPDKARARH